jgi:hypothetical protein
MRTARLPDGLEESMVASLKPHPRTAIGRRLPNAPSSPSERIISCPMTLSYCAVVIPMLLIRSNPLFFKGTIGGESVANTTFLELLALRGGEFERDMPQNFMKVVFVKPEPS